MLTREAFLRILEGAMGGKSAVSVARSAGLPDNAIAAMRKGRTPSLERAARLADAVELELYIRRKGEVFNKAGLESLIQFILSLHPAIEREFAQRVSEDPDFLALAAVTYTYFASQSDPVEAAHPDREARAVALAREYSDRLVAYIQDSATRPSDADEAGGDDEASIP